MIYKLRHNTVDSYHSTLYSLFKHLSTLSTCTNVFNATDLYVLDKKESNVTAANNGSIETATLVGIYNYSYSR